MPSTNQWFIASIDDPPSFEALYQELLPFLSQREISIMGVKRLEPRLTAWFALEGQAYSYNQSNMGVNPMTPNLRSLLDRLNLADIVTDRQFNSCLVNLYRDGSDSIGLHADHEPELGDEPVIASLSFGATRKFEFVNRSSLEKHVIMLKHGDVVWMYGDCQRRFKHSLPKDRNVTEPRLNLTFRRIYERAI